MNIGKPEFWNNQDASESLEGEPHLDRHICRSEATDAGCEPYNAYKTRDCSRCRTHFSHFSLNLDDQSMNQRTHSSEVN